MDVRVHPYIVHFSVGLIVASVALFLVAAVFRRRPWSVSLLHAARWNLWIGAACALASMSLVALASKTSQRTGGGAPWTAAHIRRLT